MNTTFLIIMIFLLGLGGLGVLSGMRARRRLRMNQPSPGQMVDVGGRNLHVYRSGTQGPSVIFLTGLGDFSLSWMALQRKLAAGMRVTVYDRAGLGWSEPGPNNATILDAAEDLRRLLRTGSVSGPHVLVGHSYGGMLARLYAHLHPEDVAGIVLVDSSHEDQFSPEPVREMLRKMAWMMPVMLGGFSMLVKSGVAALKPDLIPDFSGTFAFMDAQTKRKYRELLASRPEHLRASGNELRMVEQSNELMRAAGIRSLGDLPLVVVRHGKPQPQMGGPVVSQLLEETFVRLQEEMARLSTRGELWIAKDSGHAIHLEQPEIIVQAIQVVIGPHQRRMSLEIEHLVIGGG